ncbi:MAG: spermidine synthase [Gemmatimonadota bacterium]
MAKQPGDGAGPADRPADGARGIELLRDLDRPRAWMLLVDGTPQSHLDLDDPEYLEFEYMRRLGHLADLAAPAGEPLRALHLGAGALTLARYVAATRPGSAQLAVEADTVLVELVRRRLPLRQRARAAGGGPAGRVRIRTGDAREVLGQLAPGSFGLVVADLFAGGHTPAHVTTVEFESAVARVLSPAGVYAANVGDGPPLAHARARVATLRTVFADVCLLAEPAVLRGRRFGNLVLAASQQELPVAELTRRAAADPFPGRLVHGTDLDRFASGAKPVTDADAQPSPSPPPGAFTIKR